MTPFAPTDDIDLGEAQAHARATAEPLDLATREKQSFLEQAARLEAEATDVEGRRDGLLLRAARGDDQASGLLDQIGPHAESLRRKARDLRDAAAQLDPRIDALTREHHAAARAVVEQQHRRVLEARARAAAAFREAVAAALVLADAYVGSADAAARSHQQTFGEPAAEYRDEPPAFRAARFLRVETQRHFGSSIAGAWEIPFDVSDARSRAL
jgi:hypothetical protein